VAERLVVADTDVVIDFLRGSGEALALMRELVKEGRLRLTAVTAFELRVGTDFLVRGHRISALLARRTLPLDTIGAMRAGETYARLREQGADVGVKDALQAGVCLRFDLPLATRNLRHFERIPGLRLHPVGSS